MKKLTTLLAATLLALCTAQADAQLKGGDTTIITIPCSPPFRRHETPSTRVCTRIDRPNRKPMIGTNARSSVRKPPKSRNTGNCRPTANTERCTTSGRLGGCSNRPAPAGMSAWNCWSEFTITPMKRNTGPDMPTTTQEKPSASRLRKKRPGLSSRPAIHGT